MMGSFAFKLLCILPLLFTTGFAWSVPNLFSFHPFSKISKKGAQRGLNRPKPNLRGKNPAALRNKPAGVRQRPVPKHKPPVQLHKPVLPQQPLLQQPQAVNDYAEVDKSADARTGFLGSWELVSPNAGVSAMHVTLLPKTKKVVMFDATVWKTSAMPLPMEKMPCREVIDLVTKAKSKDCWTHSVLFDTETSKVTPMKLQTDTWCSSGGLNPEGVLVGIGGWKDGNDSSRYLEPCDTCDWREYPNTLIVGRWYSTQVILPDGRFVVYGGRAIEFTGEQLGYTGSAFSYEFIAPEGKKSDRLYDFPFLRQTNDMGLFDNKMVRVENNLYPFIYLNTDGNLFIFANNRSVLHDPYKNVIVREYPVLPGGARNYPASGMSALLPIKLYVQNPPVLNLEVLVCGGALPFSYLTTDLIVEQERRVFAPALDDCGRMQINKPNPVWRKETMPTGRVMGDTAILPTGDILLLNGAKKGTSAWGSAIDPNFNPVLYNPKAPMGRRFKELAPSNIPRMYHSSFVLLPDGKVLVSGSNTNDGYIYEAQFPTELRVEKFSPPYLDPQLANLRQEIVAATSDKVINYGKRFTVQVKSKEAMLNRDDLKVTMYSPPFTTHGISMNQRLLSLGIFDIQNNVAPGTHNIFPLAPPTNTVAPPGYYLLFVVYKGVPSVAEWIQVKP